MKNYKGKFVNGTYETTSGIDMVRLQMNNIEPIKIEDRETEHKNYYIVVWVYEDTEQLREIVESA